MSELLYGRNAVLESLRAARRTHRQLFVVSEAAEKGTLQAIVSHARQVGIPIRSVERNTLNSRLGGANHQGVALETSTYPFADIEDCLDIAQKHAEQVLLVLLDHVQDPQNIGTLLRTAEVCGVHGIILPSRRSAGITPAVVNTSSGASEHLHIVNGGNLGQTIRTLQQKDVWIVGVENDSRATEFDRTDLNLPLGLVFGAEGSGLSRLTRERCDFLVRLPMRGQVSSLNVAVAGSIVLYAAWRQRTGKREQL